MSQQENAGNPLAPYVKVRISQDRLTAIGTFSAPPTADGEEFAQVVFLKALLTDQKVTHGLREDAELQRILDEWVAPIGGVVLAHGDPAVLSVDEAFEYCFERHPEASPRVMVNGTVDFRELDLVQMAKAGQVLMRKSPGIPGRPGVNVHGGSIPVKPPQVHAFPMGEGTGVGEDPMALLALMDGEIVCSVDGKVSVMTVHCVNGDVDFSCGNIAFPGSIVVRGNVRAGFTVKAQGNIEIQGLVEAASLIAGGDITVRGGVQGSFKQTISPADMDKLQAPIQAGGAIRALYLQNAVVDAQGDITVSDSIMHSVVRGKNIHVKGKKGLLVGGLTIMQESVFARVIGSPLATPTRIQARVEGRQGRTMAQVEEEIASRESNLGKIAEMTRMFDELERRKNGLSPDQADKRSKLRQTEEVFRREISQLQAEHVQLALEVEKAKAITRVVQIGTTAFSGVHIQVGADEVKIDEEVGPRKYVHTIQGWQVLRS